MASAQELVQSCSTVFTLPEIYTHVRDIVDNPTSTTDDLTNALKLDPAICARVLKIVNSPLYGLQKQVENISRAVNLMGMQSISDLVAATTIGRRFTGMTAELMDLEGFWRKSVLCAIVGGKLAKKSGIDDSERFFVEGLMRDIGHLVLYQAAPKLAQSAMVEASYLGASLAEVEQASIGCDFTEVGGELIRFWDMPASIEQAVRYQLNPDAAGDFALNASIVHLAGNIADHAELDPRHQKQWAPCNPSALSHAQFNPDTRPALLKEAQAQLQKTLAYIYPMTLAA